MLRSSVCSHPVWRALSASGGPPEPLSLLPSGPGLRSGSLLRIGVHGAERPAARARYATVHRHKKKHLHNLDEKEAIFFVFLLTSCFLTAVSPAATCIS